MTDWRNPVRVPLFTDALIQEIIDVAKEGGFIHVETDVHVGHLATAEDTPLRFSGAGHCGRQVAYEALGLDNPLDPASLHVAFIGSVYHALLQPAIQRRYPGAKVEVVGSLFPICNNSGRADGVIDDSIICAVVEWSGGRVLYELKTKSSFQFDKAAGIARKAYNWTKDGPAGPSLDVLLQAALNATAHGCETVVIGYVTFENIGLPLAAKLELRQFERFLNEWHIPRDVWQPMANVEIERLNEILRDLDLGYLPDRLVPDPDDPSDQMLLNPSKARPDYRCDYCALRGRCEDDGPGVIPIPVDIRPKEGAA